MPILGAEPAIYPPDLLDASPSVAGVAWSVLHVKPRQEKCLARSLWEQQVPFYLPLISRPLRVRNRLLHSHQPLFAGYLFLHADRDGWMAALATRRVVRTLDVAEQVQLGDDLRHLKRLLDSGMPVRAEDHLGPGDLVEIRDGPLAGLRGQVVRSASGQRFVVQVNFIQRGASVLMEHCNLERIPHEACAAP